MKPERNMYGCLPCPKCGSVYRYPFNENGKNAIVCDDCGRRGPWDGEYSDNGYAVDETQSPKPRHVSSVGFFCTGCGEEAEGGIGALLPAGHVCKAESNCSCDQRGRNVSCDRCKK
jgi:hypothetical protein